MQEQADDKKAVDNVFVTALNHTSSTYANTGQIPKPTNRRT